MDYKIDIVGIEKAVSERLKSVCDHVFVNNAPNAVSEQMNEYIVADILGGVSNHNAYKKSYAYLSIYVRNKKSGVQDSVQLDKTINDVLELFPIVADGWSMITPYMTYGRKVGEFTQAIIRCDFIL